MLLEDIKRYIETNIHKIRKYGFEGYNEQQLAYEYHFELSNGKNIIDIYFELISSTHIWIKINGYHLENIIEHKEIELIDKEITKLYETNFQSYLKENNSSFLEKNYDLYETLGKELNKKKINIIFKTLESKYLEIVELINETIKSEKNSIENIVDFKDDIKELKKLNEEGFFIDKFKGNTRLIIDTDKCEIEISSIEELNDIINTLLRQNINKIEWHLTTENCT